MSLRPLPDISDNVKLAKLGREHALRSAWFDAIGQLRDAHTVLSGPDDARHAEAINAGREAIDRLDQLLSMRMA